MTFTSTAPDLLPRTTLTDGTAHLYWRDLDTGETKLVDRKWDTPLQPAGTAGDGTRLSADGTKVLFETAAGDVIEGYGGAGTETVHDAALPARHASRTPRPCSSPLAIDGSKSGTGGTLDDAPR